MLWSRTALCWRRQRFCGRNGGTNRRKKEIIDAEIAAAEEQVQRHRRAAEWQDRLEKFRRDREELCGGTGKVSHRKREIEEAEERGGRKRKFKECGCPARFGTKCEQQLEKKISGMNRFLK